MDAREDPLVGIDAWRSAILRTILRVVLVAGTVVAVPSIWLAIATGEVVIAVVDAVALATVAALYALPGAGYRTRAVGLLIVVYAVGVMLISSVGLVSHVYLLAVPVLAAVLLGFRAALVALTLNAVTLVTAGALGQFDDRLRLGGVDWPAEWLVITVNFLFVNAVLAMSSAVLLQRLASAESKTRQLTAAVAKARDVIVVGDAGGRVVYANEAAEELRERLGRSSPWQRLEEFAEAADQHRDLRQSLLAGEAGRYSLALSAAGERLEFDARLTPVDGDPGDPHTVVAVLRDVTRERRTEVSLRQAEKLEALAVLAGGTAHDFNNALASILAVAEEARQRTGDERMRRDLTTIVGACDRARDVVKQLVAFGQRSEDGRRPVELRAVVSASLPLLRAALSSRRVRIDPDLRSDALVMARPSELEQVLNNLVTNAAHAMGSDPQAIITVRVEERVRDVDASAHQFVVLSVGDHGTGIDPDLVDRIFEPFFTTKGHRGGSGLGLASVAGIVASLDGHVDVETTPGVGTTFHVWLPRAPHPVTDEPPFDPAVAPRSVRILLVDDEDLIRDLAAAGLARAGYEVVTAADGRAALEAYRSDPRSVDVLVTDLAMPGLDGAALVAELRDQEPSLPVLLCSGHGEDTVLPGPDDRTRYLAKPYTLAELTGSVRDLLARGVAARTLEV